MHNTESSTEKQKKKKKNFLAIKNDNRMKINILYLFKRFSCSEALESFFEFDCEEKFFCFNTSDNIATGENCIWGSEKFI